jgi:hypothetical protein
MLNAIKYNILLILTLTAIFGCHTQLPKPEGFPKELYLCKLTILQKESPLHEAVVQLVPVTETEKSWSIGGRTDKNGIVAVHTHGKWNGAPPGIYKIVVFKKYREIIKNKDIYYALVDEKFATPKTTPLELEIKGDIIQTFDVGSPIKKKIP